MGALCLTVDVARPAKAAAALDAKNAETFVQSLAEQAIGILSADNSDRTAQLRVFRELLNNGFDLAYLARYSLGPYAPSSRNQGRDTIFTESQLTDYEELFDEFILHKYSAMLSGYSGQTFDVTGSIPRGSKYVFVQSRIASGGTQPVKVEWWVRTDGDAFKIVNVVIENISTRKAGQEEITAVIRRRGVDGLLNLMRRLRDENSPSTGG